MTGQTLGERLERIESALANRDLAAVLALEPQVKALREAIEAALPAMERLYEADEDAAGLLRDNLSDAVGEDCPVTGSIAGILDAFSTFGAATVA